jgi:hypothetical protein
MLKKILLVAVLMLALGVTSSAAQDTTTTTTTVEQTQSVQIFFVACADQAVINLSGTLLAGWDVYYQVFGGAGGTGTPLTGLRQVQANDAFAFSERPGYPAGSTLGPGSIGSVRVVIGREGNPDTTDFDTTVDDVQDGCSSPQNAETTSVDLGGAGGGGDVAPPAEVQPDILAPGDGTLNPNREVEDLVEIGARQSDFYRSGTPGLIFAECDEFPEAAPGTLYDTDNIVIFWSWFARTDETMQQHLANANYSVKMNTARLPNATANAPVEREGDIWVFYTVPVGNLLPGHYEIEFKLTWNQPISDGYDDFGPGTPNDEILSLCNFDVVRNPSGGESHPNLSFNPSSHPVHDIQPQY